MKLTCILMMCVLMELSAATYAQRITMSISKASLEQVMEQIKNQSGYNFIYDADLLEHANPVTLNVTAEPVDKVLQKCFADQPMQFLVNGKTVIVKADLSKNLTIKKAVEAKEVKVDIPISGTVTDIKGVSLPGVTVRLKGTTVAVSTDINGRFTINAPSAEGAVLTFSFVGFATQEYAYKKGSNINIVLVEENKGLNEVVVVGFGTQKKATVTGSISSVSTKELVQSPTANISNSLVGRLPGLSATQGNGEPGQDQSTIRIRGVGTFSGNSAPLVLVDGIEVPNFNNIDANEIESLTILKDASSTAIYGIRGANGVILITTKRGKTGPPQIQYTFNEALNSFTALRNEMDSYNFAKSDNQAILNDSYVTQSAYVPRYSASDIAKYQDGSDPLFHPNTNWYKLFFKKVSAQQQHNLNVSGGTDAAKYFISAGYFSQDGLYKDTRNVVPGFDANSDYRRYNFRSNFDFRVTKDFKVRFDASNQTEVLTGANNTSVGNITNGSRSSSLFNTIASANPTDALGIYNNKIVNIVGSNNPYIQLLQNGYQRSYISTLNGSIRLDYDLHLITKGLGTHASINYQNYYNQTIQNRKNLIYYTIKRNPDNSIFYTPSGEDDPSFQFAEGFLKNRRTVSEFGFDYNRSFGQHNVTGLLIYQQTKAFDPTLQYDIPNGYQAVRGRVTYNYKSRYLAEVSAAYEGTENFAPGKRFGFFPAYSLGWVPSEEPFFPKNNVLTYLKIRGSYGTTGNDRIGGARFLYNPTAYLITNPLGVASSGVTGGYYFGNVGSNYQAYPGAVEGVPGNPNLTWERSIKRNIGVEMNFLKNTVSVIADLFDEKRSNILATPQSISAIAGYVPPPSNLGKMTNKGFDGSITYSNAIGGFAYRVGANYSFARNKILFQDEIPPAAPYQARTGQRLGQYFGYIADGLFNSWAEVNDPNRPVYSFQSRIQPGDVKFRDINGDGIIDSKDIVPIGYSNIPEKTYGLSLFGSYKGFDLSVLFQGAANVSLQYSLHYISGFYDSIVNGAPDYLSESWTAERYAQGLPINFPRFTAVNNQYNYQASTFFTVNASYLRLKNTELGYTLNGKYLKKVGLSSARLFVNANNIYTWDHVFKGVDPENTILTGNNEPYPLTRTINLGVNVKF